MRGACARVVRSQVCSRVGKMFVKATHFTSGGRQLTYLQLVESYREGGRVRQRGIAKLGREDELDRDAIERLVRSLAKYADVEVGAGNVLDDVELLPGRAFGHVHGACQVVCVRGPVMTRGGG